MPDCIDCSRIGNKVIFHTDNCPKSVVCQLQAASKLLGVFTYHWSAFGMGFKYCIHCHANDEQCAGSIQHKKTCPVIAANDLLRRINNATH